MKWHLVFSKVMHGQNPLPLYSPRPINIDGHKICLVKSPEGIHAVADKCPHAGGSLSSGYCSKEGHIVCPLHRHHYKLIDGKGLQGDFIEVFPVKEDESGIWLGLPEAKSWWKFWE